GRCRPGVVTLTVEGRAVTGQARFEREASNINGTVAEDGRFGATIGFQPLTGRFSRDELVGSFRSFECDWTIALPRTKELRRFFAGHEQAAVLGSGSCRLILPLRRLTAARCKKWLGMTLASAHLRHLARVNGGRSGGHVSLRTRPDRGRSVSIPLHQSSRRLSAEHS